MRPVLVHVVLDAHVHQAARQKGRLDAGRHEGFRPPARVVQRVQHEPPKRGHLPEHQVALGCEDLHFAVVAESVGHSRDVRCVGQIVEPAPCEMQDRSSERAHSSSQDSTRYTGPFE